MGYFPHGGREGEGATGGGASQLKRWHMRLLGFYGFR